MRALVVAAAAIAAAGPVAAETIRIRDALGRDVVLAAPPQRIVTIFASNTELVAALGLVDRIVGIEAYTRFPPEVRDKPLVGGRLGFSVDAVVTQRPDLVVVTPARQAAHQLVDPMERLGVPVIVLTSRTMREVLSNIRLLAVATGVPERGDAVAAALQRRLDALAAPQPRPSVVMITGRLGNGLMLVARPDTYTGDAVVLAGGRFALAGRGMVPQVSPESIMAADPDILLFAGRQQDLDDLVRQAGWRDMRAVRAGRAVVVPRAELLIPGPRTVDGIERMAALFRSVAAGTAP